MICWVLTIIDNYFMIVTHLMTFFIRVCTQIKFRENLPNSQKFRLYIYVIKKYIYIKKKKNL